MRMLKVCQCRPLKALLCIIDFAHAWPGIRAFIAGTNLDLGQYLKNCFLQDCERVVTLGWQLYLLTIILVPIISGGPIFELIARIVIAAVHALLFWKGCDMQRRLDFILRRLRWNAHAKQPKPVRSTQCRMTCTERRVQFLDAVCVGMPRHVAVGKQTAVGFELVTAAEPARA